MTERINTPITRRQALVVAAGTAAAVALPAARAQSSWPSKPVRFLVPFAPGGTSEIVARSVAAELTKPLGVSGFVENTPGGAGVNRSPRRTRPVAARSGRHANGRKRRMSGSQERGGGSNTGVQPERKPDPGPASPGPAPPGPAVHPERHHPPAPRAPYPPRRFLRGRGRRHG